MRQRNAVVSQLPGRVELRHVANRNIAVLDLLRQFAMRQQRDQPRRFPSIRQTATHFDVPVSAIARIYAQLEREGLLIRVRGAHTMLKGRRFARPLHVRAVIGLPASLFCFIALQDYRHFLESMRRELARRDFATAQVFYRPRELRDDRLTDRLTGKAVDAIVWYLPERAILGTLDRLKDRGVPVVAVCDGGLPVMSCRYAVRRTPAMRTILRDWAAGGVSVATIVTEPLKRSAADEERWQRLAEEQHLEVRFAMLHEHRAGTDISRLTADAHHGVILLASAASLAAFRAPNALIKLMNNCRVALPDGAVTLLFATKVPDAEVDLISVDWRKAASRIVDDVISQTAFDHARTVEFTPRAHIRARLNDYAEDI